MSISMEKFASEGHFATYDPYIPLSYRITISTLQCRNCGFEPEDVVVAPKLCPKCHGHAWERMIKPGSILNNAERYAPVMEASEF